MVLFYINYNKLRNITDKQPETNEKHSKSKTSKTTNTECHHQTGETQLRRQDCFKNCPTLHYNEMFPEVSYYLKALGTTAHRRLEKK